MEWEPAVSDEVSVLDATGIFGSGTIVHLGTDDCGAYYDVKASSLSEWADESPISNNNFGSQVGSTIRVRRDQLHKRF